MMELVSFGVTLENNQLSGIPVGLDDCLDVS